MADRRFPRFSRKGGGLERIVPESAPVVIDVPLERKDAATRRASVGRGFTYANQPYVPNGGDIERIVRDGYEKVIWVFKGVDATAEKLSSWPIEAMKGKEPTWRKVDDPVLALLNDYTNNIERAAKYFRYRLISQLMLSKRGVFVEAIPTRGGDLAALNLLPPAYTSCLPDPDKFLAGFRVDVPGMEGHIDLPVYDPEKKAGVVWIRKPHPTDPYSSITPLEAAGISIDLDFYARLYNRNFLLNDGRAGQIVAVKGGLSPEDARELKARFTPGMAGAGRTTVIEADTVSVNDTATSPRDAQYAELRDITKQDLLIALGTPESLWNASGRTFDNADAEKENWLDVTVLPLGGVMTSGMDVLTAGGYDDDVRLRHDVSNEPVLKRRHAAKVEQARKDVAAGLISIAEFREIAEKDPVEAAGARVLWIPSGKVGIGGDVGDEGTVAKLKPVGGPPTGPVDGGFGGGFGGEGADLTGFDAQLDGLSGPSALSSPQADPTALTAAGEDLSDLEVKDGLELEEKAFNPKQPRYPMNHPHGGRFMDTGDVARWLAGKPLKDGSPASSVTDPNAGSTASPAGTPGGTGGAMRFLSHSDPKVRAAAYAITFPANYQYPRVLGAPPATIRPKGPSKLVSLRKGDVVRYSGYSAPSGAQGPWAVAKVKRLANGNVTLELVNDDGDFFELTAGGQQTIGTEARTPHPSTVAEAKRVVTAAAKAAAGSSPAPTAAPAPAPAAAPAPAPAAAPAASTLAGPTGPFLGNDLQPGAVFTVHDATVAGLPAGSRLELQANGTARLWNASTGSYLPTPLAAPQVVAFLGSQQGGGFTRTVQGTAPAAPAAPATPAAPPATPGATPTVTPTVAGLAAPPSGWTGAMQVVSGARFVHPGTGAEIVIGPDGVGVLRTTTGATTRNQRLGKAATKNALGPGSGYLLATTVATPQYDLPPVPAGATVFAHPDGKHIYVFSGGGMEVWKPDGTRGTSSATAQKLWAGHGKWQMVSAPATGPRPLSVGQQSIIASLRQQTPSSGPPAPAPTPAPAARVAPAPAPAAAPTLPKQPAAAAAPSPSPASSAPAAPSAAVTAPSRINVGGYTVSGTRQGSNAAAELTSPTGERFYVKSQPEEVSGNEVTAGMLYRAAGVEVPEIRPATIPSGTFGGQSATTGIASKIVAGTSDVAARMGRNAGFRDRVHEDFAVHAWLANWDAMENDNTVVDPAGRPLTIDVGGSLRFRAQGGRRKMTDQVAELSSMRSSTNTGPAARQAFSGVTPDHTDARFVRGVERVAAISPQQIRSMVDAGYASLPATERDELVRVLIARRAHLASVARVDLPENRRTAAPAAAAAPTPAPAPVAAPSPAPAAPAAGAAATTVAGYPQSVLVPPANYPYPVVSGAPVATALPRPKMIKAASLRKGDVIDGGGGSPLTVVSVDRKSGTVTVQNRAGAVVAMPASPNGDYSTLARTPHPPVVAAARRAAAQSGPGAQGGAPQAPAPAAPAAPSAPQRLRPSLSAGANAAQAARNTGTPQAQGYAPVPGVTYAAPRGDVLIVHPDGTSTVHNSAGNQVHMDERDTRDLLDPGTSYVPVSNAPTTSKFSIEVGRYTTPAGSVLDVRTDGTGTLTPPGGSPVTVTEDAVDALVNMIGPALNPQAVFARTGWAPSQRTTPGTGQVAAAPAAGPLTTPQTAPPGGWVQAGQVVPGAVFVNANGDTLSVGPRGGGKLTAGGQSRNMSAQALRSHLSRRASQWNLQTPGAQALAAAPSPAPSSAPAAPAARPAAPAAGGFKSQAGQLATDVVKSSSQLQAGQTFTQPKTGNAFVVQPDGSVLWTAGPKSRATNRTKTYPGQRAWLAMQTNGYTATSGPDIDAPGAIHNAALRRAAASQPLPAPGTPVVVPAPPGAVYPPAAVGSVTGVNARSLVRGQTIRVAGEDWIVTETHPGREVWGYRPGIDDPNTLTQDAATKKWRQGVRVPVPARGDIDLVGPPPVPAANVPTNGAARPHDSALGAASAVSVGAQHGAPFSVNTQTVPADQLKAGDVIVLNNREAEGTFVVTAVGTDAKGRQNVQGYAGTTADKTGTPGVGQHLFLTNPNGTPMRQVPVQVDGAVPPPPDVPRPTPPRGPTSIVRNDISDPTSQQKALDIVKSPPPRLSSSGLAITQRGDTILGHLYELRGYNAHPDVVTEAEMDQHVADGEIELWRGMEQVRGVDVAEDYRSGNHFPGGGASMYGAGTYAAYGGNGRGQQDAIKFTAGSYASSGGGVQVRMTLKSDARIIEAQTLCDAFNADTGPVATALRKKFGRPGQQRAVLRTHAKMLGHYAVYMGYDAIRKSHGYDSTHPASRSNDWDHGFLVILNRSAVRISEKNYVPNGRQGSAPAGANPPPLTMADARHKMTAAAKHSTDVDYQVRAEP